MNQLLFYLSVISEEKQEWFIHYLNLDLIMLSNPSVP